MRLALLVLSLAMAGWAEDWPQWRGPDRDGTTAGFEAPAAWPGNLQKGWQIEVGEGHSAPIVIGETVYQFSREGDSEVLRALRLADGQELWSDRYPVPYEMNPAARGHGKGPKATPIFADGRIYTFGITGTLSCYGAEDGELYWRKTFEGDFAQTEPKFGAAMSPAVVDGKLLAHVGGHDDGALLAMEAATGEPLWRWAEDGPSYASPLVVSIGGVRQVLTQTQQFVVGVDFASGKTLWKIPFSTPYDQNILTPVLLDDLLIYSGTRQPTFAVRISKQGGEWRAEQVWSNDAIPMYMSTPVLSGELLIGLTQRDKGVFFGANARTGEIFWESDPRQGDNAALALAGDLLIAVTTEAELLVARPDRQGLNVVKAYEVASSNVWAHPAFAGPHILIKDKTTLARWSVR